MKREPLFGVAEPSRLMCQGFTLVELMIVVAVLGIVSAIAIPAYQGYIEDARTGTMLQSIETIRVFQENRRLEQGEYVEGSYNPASPDAAGGLKEAAVLDWSPYSSNDVVTFVIACQTDATSPECARSSGYQVTATHSEGGSVCRIINRSSLTIC